MSDRDPQQNMQQLLRKTETRLSRLEHLPRGNGLPPGGEPGKVLGFNVEGQAAWVTTAAPWPPGQEGEFLNITGFDLNTGEMKVGWTGPLWFAWTGTEEEYLALGVYDPRVLYVIQEEFIDDGVVVRPSNPAPPPEPPPEA